MTGVSADHPTGPDLSKPEPDRGAQTPGASEPDRLVLALETLRAQLDALRLPLHLPGAEAARRDRAGLLDQLDDYLLPRLRQLEAPLLAVVGGSTGAGKSTLVNSVLREQVTRSGVLRPTTRSPVLVHHPRDADWFTGQRILPSLARLTGTDPEPGVVQLSERITAVRLVASSALAPGLALLDAPDIDSVVDANRELATQLLAAADLWIFVTTAARYADAVPWDLLRTAARRGTAVSVVLDRVPPDAVREIRQDLGGMLSSQDLAAAPLFVVEEVALVQDLLPLDQIGPLRDWLTGLASSEAARQEVVRRTLDGALDSLRKRVPATAAAADAQATAHGALVHEVEMAYTEADRALDRGLTDGTLLRGEVLARWQEFVGTGEILRTLEATVGRIRDRLVSVVTGRPRAAEPLGQALQSGVAMLVRAQAEEAAETSVLRWRAHPAGGPLVAANPGLDKLPGDFDDRLERLIRDWQGFVLDLVRAQGAGRRNQARVLSLGVNALGIVLMVVVFASTAAIPTGAEVGIGAGTALAGQKLLEAIFGDQAVRRLAAEARAELMRRVDDLLAGERDRFLTVLRREGVDEDAAAALRTISTKVQAAR